MSAGHAHSHPHPAWGEPRPSLVQRVLARLRSLIAPAPAGSWPGGLGELPLVLRRGDLAEAYLAAERDVDHGRAGAAASAATERAISGAEWWPADVWAHRALWHYERAGEAIESIRMARRIGDLRTSAGDAASARRYYAEAIDEGRDIGAEREQGLATIGLGRALLELGNVSDARRLAGAAIDLLSRAEAPPDELSAARALLGEEVAVGEPTAERG